MVLLRLLNSSICATTWSVHLFAEAVLELHVFFVHFFKELETQLLVLEQFLLLLELLVSRTLRNICSFLDLDWRSESGLPAGPARFDWICARIFGQREPTLLKRMFLPNESKWKIQLMNLTADSSLSRTSRVFSLRNWRMSGMMRAFEKELVRSPGRVLEQAQQQLEEEEALLVGVALVRVRSRGRSPVWTGSCAQSRSDPPCPPFGSKCPGKWL